MAGDVTRQFVIHSNESQAKFIDAQASRYGNTVRHARENASEKNIIYWQPVNLLSCSH